MNAHGSFIWYELVTKDAAKAKAFYDSVCGWNIDAEPAPGGMDYRMINAADGQAGGVMQLNADMIAGGARPVWLGYLGVDDVDASVAAVVAAGGQVHLPAFDIPDVGRLAMVTDPQGVPFYVMRGASPHTSTAYQRMGLGHVAWNELLAPDDDAALAFYEKLFAITKVGGMPMGEMGEYSFIANGDSKGEAVGAIMRAQPGTPPGWRFYVRVPDITDAIARVEVGGGKVVWGPEQVPGGEWVISIVDPEGVACGFVSPGKS
ncbi:VOC family protein [Sphingomonas sp. CBMAI 2297]|uniref:VOC family protein n=1 Tax=Sphingomonas sp. CBMAI 2297 TaxID=2991720 RepID=UPI00245553E8|nr:VOC family protein [Sphingomonas sp. CBMAI 2297]MDH4744273.1 VOC family protein [Sphingomonas sp. CBMAI 2297]